MMSARGDFHDAQIATGLRTIITMLLVCSSASVNSSLWAVILHHIFPAFIDREVCLKR